MTTTQQTQDETTTAIVPRSELVPKAIGGTLVPRTVEALEKLLAATKNNAWPLPFRADVLPEPVRILLYSVGGVPEKMPPNCVSIFTGRPYVDAVGAIDMAISEGCKLWTERPEIVHCLDPVSGCPGEVKIKTQGGQKVIKATE